MTNKYMEELTKEELEKLHTIVAENELMDYIFNELNDTVVEYGWLASDIGIDNFKVMYLGKSALRLVNNNLKENNMLLKIDTGVIDAYVHIRIDGNTIYMNIYEDIGDGAIELESCLKLIAVTVGEDEGFEYYKYCALTDEDDMEDEGDFLDALGMLKIVGDNLGLEEVRIAE